MAEEKIGSEGQAWFYTTGLPSDVVIMVGSMSFHLHKFPLMSKSQRLHRLITEREKSPRMAREGDEEIEEEEEEEMQVITLTDFPGGASTFEATAKFCYGVKIDLSSSTVAAICCAAEYLEMTDDFAEDNLTARAERLVAHTVLRSAKESARVLRSCEGLMPAAEDLGLVQRCIDSIAAASSCSSTTSSRTLLSWPVAAEGGDVGARRRAADTWVEELSALSLPIYKRVIAAMKVRDVLNTEAIEGSLVSYAKRSIPGISRSSRNYRSPVASASEREQKELLEIVITNLPKVARRRRAGGSGTVTTRFLSGLLRTANILHSAAELRSAVEKKIASQLEEAVLDDLLVPSYSYLDETLYDVECVERILGHYLSRLEEEEEDDVVGSPPGAALARVGRLVDGYLSEIASDTSLTPEQFCGLALALPARARRYDDGLYRAVDVYLKAHPGMTEEERERVSGVVDSGKFTLEACVHAAQNERMPLRAVVQVLFSEQMQLRRAVAGKMVAAEGEEGEGWREAARENQVLRLDMDSVRGRVQELEWECTRLRKEIAKMDDMSGGSGGEKAGIWGTLARRFGCKTTTQVCDSHEPAVVLEARQRTS